MEIKSEKHGSLKYGAAQTFSNAAWLVPLLVKKVSKTKSLFITLFSQNVTFSHMKLLLKSTVVSNEEVITAS